MRSRRHIHLQRSLSELLERASIEAARDVDGIAPAAADALLLAHSLGLQVQTSGRRRGDLTVHFADGLSVTLLDAGDVPVPHNSRLRSLWTHAHVHELVFTRGRRTYRVRCDGVVSGPPTID